MMPQRSSGPRTAAGRSHSSRNARKHGLAVPIAKDQIWAHRTECLAREIAGDGAGRLRLEQARVIAEAELDLMRVRAVRTRLFELTGLARLCVREETCRAGKRASADAQPREAYRDDVASPGALKDALQQISLLGRTSAGLCPAASLQSEC